MKPLILAGAVLTASTLIYAGVFREHRVVERTEDGLIRTCANPDITRWFGIRETCAGENYSYGRIADGTPYMRNRQYDECYSSPIGIEVVLVRNVVARSEGNEQLSTLNTDTEKWSYLNEVIGESVPAQSVGGGRIAAHVTHLEAILGNRDYTTTDEAIEKYVGRAIIDQTVDKMRNENVIFCGMW